MKLKQLESLLSEGVLPFEEPKVDLEQVSPPPRTPLASDALAGAVIAAHRVAYGLLRGEGVW